MTDARKRNGKANVHVGGIEKRALESDDLAGLRDIMQDGYMVAMIANVDPMDKVICRAYACDMSVWIMRLRPNI